MPDPDHNNSSLLDDPQPAARTSEAESWEDRRNRLVDEATKSTSKARERHYKEFLAEARARGEAELQDATRTVAELRLMFRNILR